MSSLSPIRGRRRSRDMLQQTDAAEAPSDTSDDPWGFYRDMLQRMDAAEAPSDTFDDPWEGYYRPVVTRSTVVLDGRTYIVEETSYEPLSHEAEVERISRLMQPHMFLRPGSSSYRTRPDSPESDANRSVKRARVAASSDAILGLQEARPGGMPAECAVCLQDFVAEDRLRAMPCSHTFHQDCIFRWLRVNHVCPLCRHALPTQLTDDDGNYQEESMALPEEA